PVGRSPLPIGRSPLPIGRSPLPVGRSPLPIGRSPLPIGRSPLPVGRRPFLVGRRDPPIRECLLRVWRCRLPVRRFSELELWSKIYTIKQRANDGNACR